MGAVPGYTLSELLYESANSTVYRARRHSDNQPVILKLLTEDYPPPEKIAWFRREYEILHTFHLPGMVQAHDFQADKNRWMIVLEDFGGDSLKRLNLAGTLAPHELLPLAIAITDALAQIHQHHLIHKDINPANIVYNPQTQQVKLIDFGIATRLSRETSTFCNPNVLEGTLAYISPEQTGRMNRAIDERSDFYSFGVTLYELLTGSLPFSSDDPLELVHSHIARQAVSPDEQYRTQHPDGNVPQSLLQGIAAVIRKLMAKNAEDRYQSAYGIKADLQLLAQPAGLPVLFLPGQYDISERLFIPQKLYGRENELATLYAAFERVSQASSELVLVSGVPGIGKSALVQELARPITRQRGYFISGKFDQFQRNIPYSALIQALRTLLRYLLTESASRITTWREQLQTALGSNGAIISELLPEIELIIGPQPAVIALAPAEAQNRFNLTMQRFIQVFARAEHPLVMVLDDMQWADSASLTLLQQLLSLISSDEQPQALLVIGTYRDSEIRSGHPLHMLQQALDAAQVTVNELHLAPLDQPVVQQFLVETLHTSDEQVGDLARLLVAKTEGNPFFLAEFLHALYTDELLRFDQQHGCWQWDMHAIQTRQITENVADLVTARLQQMAHPTQQLLKQAACIGHQFDLLTLANVASQPTSQVAHHLEDAMHNGFITPLNDTYKLMTLELAELTEDVSVAYAFAHDRIQQAVYARIEEDERQSLHWHIGTLLLQRSQANEHVEEHIFDIVAHLNQGMNRLVNSEQGLTQRRKERKAPDSNSCVPQASEGKTDILSSAHLAALNLLAGSRARSSGAYTPAYSYLQTGLDMLNQPADGLSPWQRDYPLALQLHTATAEAAYLTGDFATMEHLASVVLENASSVLDTIKIYEVKILAAMAQNHLNEAVQTALHVLHLLGQDLPAEPTPADFMQGLEQVSAALDGRSITALSDLPAMQDAHVLAAMQMLTCVMAAAYLTSPMLSALITCKEVQLSLLHGNAPMSPFAYGMYGFIQCGILGDIASGYQFGELALNLAEHPSSRAYKASTMHVVNAGVRHWQAHVADTVPAFLEAYRTGLEVGDIQYAANALYMHVVSAFISGKNLQELAQQQQTFRPRIAQLKQQLALTCHELYRQLILNLTGASDDPLMLIGEAYDEISMLPLHQAASDQLALHLYFSHKLLLCYLFHAWEQAVQYAEQAEQTIDGVTSSAQVPFFYFYDSLARLALLRTHPPADETAWQTLLDKVDANQQKLQQWATHAPMNQQHRWCLVDAERARFSGNEGYAWQQYHQAIALAKEHGYLPEEALAYELLACFHEHKGEADVAALYMRKAHYGFQRWGALARTRFMEEQYAHLFKASQSKLSTSDPRRITIQLATERTPNLHGTTDETANVLDFASVIKASQTIAGEIVLDTLLAKLMDTMLENAGAERGLLLLERNGQWMIEAEGSIHAPPQVLQSIPLSETTALPHAVLNYVLHTHKSIVLNDAVETDQFGQDTYILQHHPRSILCTPLLSQGKLSGVLYLENRQTVGVFTTDRLQVLNLLYGHIAISLENAHLYAEVQEREQKYRTLFEETKDVIFISDLAGNILDMNPAGLLLFGLEQPEPNATLQQLAASPASQHELLQAITTDGLVHDFAITMRSTQGLLIECVLTATLHQTDDGSPMHLHGIIRDVTQQKQAEQERLQLTAMQRELAIARNIQQSLLPAPTPVWEQLDMVCYTTPAREVGGDWYAYHVFGQTEPAAAELSATTNDRARYALAVGDVSGKGVPAALLMAVSMASFRSVVEQQVPPATFLARMDKAIASYTHATRQNCALVYLELVAYEGAYTLLVANAGCIPPLLKRQDGEVCWIEVGGLPLGINMAHKVVYQEHRLHLAAGDMLILTSDGVVEATNADGEMFGFEQLEQVIAHAPAHTAEAMLTALRTAVETFVNDQEPHDDMTIVAVRVPG